MSDPSMCTDDALPLHPRVFFGHQSVGADVVSRIPAACVQLGLEQPTILETRGESHVPPAFFAHARIGRNGSAHSKIEDFARVIRSGLGPHVDVALMKLCYIDVTARTDVWSLFGTYCEAMGRLSSDLPHLRIVHSTVPLTTRPTKTSALKSALVGRAGYSVRDNAARERYNNLIRGTFGGAVFDIARAQSTASDGSRIAQKRNGERFFHLAPAYAADAGHLNELGSRLAAEELLLALRRPS